MRTKATGTPSSTMFTTEADTLDRAIDILTEEHRKRTLAGIKRRHRAKPREAPPVTLPKFSWDKKDSPDE